MDTSGSMGEAKGVEAGQGEEEEETREETKGGRHPEGMPEGMEYGENGGGVGDQEETEEQPASSLEESETLLEKEEGKTIEKKEELGDNRRAVESNGEETAARGTDAGETAGGNGEAPGGETPQGVPLLGGEELAWTVITPAQSPIAPVLEEFPPPQQPVVSTVQSPQTPLISTIEEASGAAAGGGVDGDVVRETLEALEQALLEEAAGGEREPLLQEGTVVEGGTSAVEVTGGKALVEGGTPPDEKQGDDDEDDDNRKKAESPTSALLPAESQTASPPPAMVAHPVATQAPTSPSASPPLAAPPLASPPLGAPPAGHSSGLVPLRLSRLPGLPTTTLALVTAGSGQGQPVLTTLQSPLQPHRQRQAAPPPQPVLAPLQLPWRPLPPGATSSSPLDPTSAITSPPGLPGDPSTSTTIISPSYIPPSPSASPHHRRRRRLKLTPPPSSSSSPPPPRETVLPLPGPSGPSYIELGAAGLSLTAGPLTLYSTTDVASGGAEGGVEEEEEEAEEEEEEGEFAVAQPRPSRNLHLDLGWVWGQDAASCGSQPRRPERSRIRKARAAVPVSPQVAPLVPPAPEMDTADSGLGTADGDLSFAAPYPSGLLPTSSSDLSTNTTQTSFMLSDKWKSLFDKYDPEGQGELSVDDFRSLLADARFRSKVATHKLEVLEAMAGNGRSSVSYQDLVNIMSNKRRRSFKIAVHCRDQEIVSESDFRLERAPVNLLARMVRRIAKEFLTDERDRQYYADHYTCCPPPVFVPAVTLIEVGFFIYYSVEAGDISPSGPVPTNSMFIYRPDKRIEIWRFFFYMLIHAGWVHLFFNMLVQLLVGVPLEMVHGSFRIGAVYMAGVLAGSLGTSVFDMDAFLVGASGGVYALLAAHLANILLNYSEMELGIFKLVAVFIIASADVGFAVWDRYSSDDSSPPVGYVSHLMGALAGLTIGLLVLKNFQQKLHVQILWWVALGVYSVCTMFAILWNIFYY